MGEVIYRLFGPKPADFVRVVADQIDRALVDYPRYMEGCNHPAGERLHGGYQGFAVPRMPLRYGSAEVDICMKCGAWTMPVHSPGRWNAGPYSVHLRQAMIDGEQL